MSIIVKALPILYLRKYIISMITLITSWKISIIPASANPILRNIEIPKQNKKEKV